MGGSNTTATGTFVVDPTTPTVTGGGTGCAGTITLTASGALPSGGTYNWYNVSSGGTVLATGSTYVPTVAGTYYASYTYSTVEGATSTGTAVTFSSEAVISAPPRTSPHEAGLYLSAIRFPAMPIDVSGNGKQRNGAGRRFTYYRPVQCFKQRLQLQRFNSIHIDCQQARHCASVFPQNFSISVWFKTSSAGGVLVGYSASKTGLGTQYDRHIYMDNSGYLYFGIYTTSTGVANVITSTSTYADGVWHHAVGTCSTTSGSCLYVDGALVASSATA